MQAEATDRGFAWRRLLAPAVLAGLMAAAYALGLHRHLNLEAIAANRQSLMQLTSLYPVWTLLAYVVLYAGVVALSVPGASILTILGGILFGWLVGGTAAIVAGTIGAGLVFQIARTSFGESLARRAGPFLSRLKDGFNADAFNYLLFLRLVPAFPFWLVNIAPALTNVRLATFLAATFLGIIPGTFAFAFVGQGFDSIIAAQELAHQACLVEKKAADCLTGLSVSTLLTPQMLIAFVLLGLVALIPVGLKRWKAKP